MSTISKVYGFFSPTGLNQHSSTFNDDLPPKCQEVETTSEATALNDDARYLRRDDVTPAGSTIVNDVNNDSDK